VSQIEQIDRNEVRIMIDTFSGVDRSIHPSKLPIDAFALGENWVKTKQSSGGSLVKRNGIQVYNANVVTANKPVRNLYEARLYAGNYLLGKDDNGAGTSNFEYNNSSGYSGAWTSAGITSEEVGYYRFITFKDRVYICNRVDTSRTPDSLNSNKIWQPANPTELFEHGCLPYKRDAISPVTFTSTVDVNAGLTASAYYAYVITYLYDGYQESSAFDVIWKLSTEKSMLITGLNKWYNRVTHIKIYRSVNTANRLTPPEFFYYLATIPATDTSYRDTVADSLLGEAIPSEELFNDKRPYRSKHLTVAKERIIQGNLDQYADKYTALDSGDVTLTEGTASGAGLPAGKYKYRIHKAYAQHSGGRYTYILGQPLEKDITVTGSGNSITLTLSDATVEADNWLDTFVISRTTVGGNDYFYLAIAYGVGYTNNDLIGFSKDGFVNGLIDETIDTQLVSNQTIYKADFITTEGLVDSDFKNMIAISEVGKGDHVQADSIKQLDVPDNIGITGLFAEDNSVVAFSSNALHVMDTSAQSSEFWTTDKVIDGIGATGQPTAPSAEGTGHNGILQLPEGSGYIFFSRAYATTGQPVRIYYWNRQSYPEEISIPIDAYLNDGFTTLDVRGMTYDPKNNWAWATVVSSTGKKIYVYDLTYRQWYVWTLNTAIDIYDVIALQDGSILIGTGDGRMLKYTAGTYQDSYGATPTTYAFSGYLRTKHFELFDADYIAKMVIVNAQTTSNTVTLSATLYNEDTANVLTLANANIQTTHRLKARLNAKGKWMYLDISHAENKGLTINSISIDAKIKHKRDATSSS